MINRDIKFRSWNHESKKMCNWETIKRRKNLQKLMRLSFVEVIQYTGLKDKNGADIYEGDILSCKIFTDGKWIDSKQPVSFIDGCFVLKTAGDYEILSAEIDNKEILGNVFENPELISE